MNVFQKHTTIVNVQLAQTQQEVYVQEQCAHQTQTVLLKLVSITNVNLVQIH